ncbi:hypothetical protein QBC39DRAFT_409806 [Podospora conica]|nr:hypothetical protein QBC39DRAFT_409806 [Schizothecium conicum]
MANLNADDIWGFLQAHDSESVAYSNQVESEGTYYQDLLDDQYSEASTYAHESNYTVAPSTAYSSAYSSAPTIFSHRKAPTSIGTAPSRAGPGVPFAAQFAAPVAQPDLVFRCEFRDLMGCNATFWGDDEAGWIRHHVDHLGVRFPAKTICWFCDYHVPFVAQRKAERQAAFEERMEHIAEHIRSDHYSIDEMRPDFHMLEHLFKHRFINEETYYNAMRYTELPLALRHPDVGVVSPERGGRADGVEHNLEKENRERRRKKKSG